MALYNTDKVNPFIVKLDSQVDHIYGDSSFLAQVFINLLKNAKEANATQVKIQLSKLAQSNANKVLIELTDNGHGFSNLTNLFVPLYSTKETGQGIGLSFCRNIIEQHQGEISLINNVSLNQHQQGVTVTIHLPG